MCEKVPYDSKGDAARQIKHLDKKPHAKKHQYTVYPCDAPEHWGKFHIATKTKRILRPFRDKYKADYSREIAQVHRKSKKKRR